MSTLFRSTVAAFALLLSAPAWAAASTFELDSSHSTAIFRVKHLNVSWFYGRFNDITGTMVFDDADPTKSVIDVKIATGSVDTNVEKRDQHLKGPDFFNAAQFPMMTFKSKKVTKKTGNTWAVTGDLQIHGVTKEVTVDFERTGEGKDPWGGTRAGAEATFNIKRSDYGISFMPDGLSDDVRLFVSFEGVKK